MSHFLFEPTIVRVFNLKFTFSSKKKKNLNPKNDVSSHLPIIHQIITFQTKQNDIVSHIPNILLV